MAEEQVRAYKSSEGQRKILLDYMVKHPIFAKSGIAPGPRGRGLGEEMWHKLTNDLNEQGPAYKDVKGWKKCWSDLKYTTKVKVAKVLNQPTGGKGSGDAGEPVVELTDEDMTLFNLLGGRKWVGAPPEKEYALAQSPDSEATASAPSINLEDYELEEDDEILIVNDIPTIPCSSAEQGTPETGSTPKQDEPPVKRLKKHELLAESKEKYTRECGRLADAVESCAAQIKNLVQVSEQQVELLQATKASLDLISTNTAAVLELAKAVKELALRK